MADVTTEVTLTVVTCPTGHFYAVPYWVGTGYYRCPMCSVATIRKLDNELAALRRSNAALRGYLTKKGVKHG